MVSLESLAPEKASVGAKPDAQNNVAARPAAAPSVAQPKLETTTVAKSAPPMKSAPAKAFAEPSAPIAKATPKAAPVEKAPPPVAEKPASQMSDREKLNAAISKMMSSPLPSGKSGAKGKSSEYDPLNPKL